MKEDFGGLTWDASWYLAKRGKGVGIIQRWGVFPGKGTLLTKDVGLRVFTIFEVFVTISKTFLMLSPFTPLRIRVRFHRQSNLTLQSIDIRDGQSQ